LKSKFRTLGGEIGSCLAYTQKSEGQNLPERPAFARRLWRGRSFTEWGDGPLELVLDCWNRGAAAVLLTIHLLQQSITPIPAAAECGSLHTCL